MLKTQGFDQCRVVICPEQVSRAKPDPEGLLLACRLLGVKPENCIYVGDHERDIQAGNAAGMTTIGAAYGYIPADTAPQKWQADYVTQTPKELLDWLKKNQQK